MSSERGSGGGESREREGGREGGRREGGREGGREEEGERASECVLKESVFVFLSSWFLCSWCFFFFFFFFVSFCVFLSTRQLHLQRTGCLTAAVTVHITGSYRLITKLSAPQRKTTRCMMYVRVQVALY